MEKQIVQINLKMDEKLADKFRDLCMSNTRNQIKQFRYMVERDWNLLEKARQMGDEPENKG